MATKITYGRNTMVKFEEMEAGDIFSYNNFIFIRTEDEFEYDCEILNAICLNDGAFEHFEKTDEVKKIDVEINVKFI